MRYALLAIYLMAITTGHAQTKTTTAAKDSVYIMVDQPPTPTVNLGEYLSQNLNYPTEARQKNQEGRVIIKFIVTARGKVDSVKVLRGVTAILDNEAVRVVKAMPPWNQGKTKGKAVSVYFNLPIVFKLNDNK